MGITAYSVLCRKENMLCASHLCARSGQANSRRERKVHRVSFLGDVSPFAGLGLLVTFTCTSGLNNRGGVSEVHAAHRTSTQNFTHKCKTYTETRAQKYKYGIKYNKQTNKNTKIQQTIQDDHAHSDGKVSVVLKVSNWKVIYMRHPLDLHGRRWDAKLKRAASCLSHAMVVVMTRHVS